jgi:thiamine kinase-like enzyme
VDELVQIVQQLTPRLGEPDSDPVPLGGGITNRNFRVRLGDSDYVIRVPGKDTSLLEIDRAAERAANEQAAELGIAPSVAAALDDPPCLVTAFVGGSEMSSEQLREPAVIAEVAEKLAALHDSGNALPTDFNSFRVVETYAKTASERGAEIPPAYDEAISHAREIEAALSGPEHDPVPCHDDLLAANFLRDSERIWIVDWEYAGMGDRYFDLANFAVNNELDGEAEAALLEAYFGEPPSARRTATLGLMRFMSDFREAMWGVVQTAVSDLDFDFEGYATKHFDRMHSTAADPRFGGWLEEARAQGG